MIPDYCEAITAYRCWDVAGNGLLLGQAVSEPWPPYEPMQARCAGVRNSGWAIEDNNSASAHVVDGAWVSAPVFSCDCGLHGYKTLAEAEHRIVLDPNSSWGRPGVRAWGELKLWGKIVVHEQGYRAQYAYPSRLYCDGARLAPVIAQLYGVPCEVKELARPKDEMLIHFDPGRSMYWASKSLWYSFPSFQGPTYQPLGVITSLSDDIEEKPQIIAPKPRMIAPPKIVAANRWQMKQYANHHVKDIKVPDYRAILRKMVYVS